MKFFFRKSLKRQVKQLREEVARLKEEKAMPPLYNKWHDKKVPLGHVPYKMLSELVPLDIKNKVHVASDILDNEDELNCFTVWLETSEGVFVRTIEEDDERVFKRGKTYFTLNIKWKPIYIGKSMEILSMFIVHRGRIIQYVPGMQTTKVDAGKEFNITYSFNNLDIT